MTFWLYDIILSLTGDDLGKINMVFMNSVNISGVCQRIDNKMHRSLVNMEHHNLNEKKIHVLGLVIITI